MPYVTKQNLFGILVIWVILGILILTSWIPLTAMYILELTPMDFVGNGADIYLNSTYIINSSVTANISTNNTTTESVHNSMGNNVLGIIFRILTHSQMFLYIVLLSIYTCIIQNQY